MTINKKILTVLMALIACVGLIFGLSVTALAADDVTLPEGATFYYQYVITDEDFEAGARFDESYLESVQTKIENGSYVANTIVGIERSADQRTMTIYMGSAAGTEVDSVLQPYEETQPAIKVENSALAELEGWTGEDRNGNNQTLSSSYYIGAAVRDYYGQNNTTFTSSLKLKYSFIYTLTLDGGQSIDEDWCTSALAAIEAETETGVLAIEKSEDGKTYTMYFDAYKFYNTNLSLPDVTLSDTSTQIFDNAWTDGGSNTLSTTDRLATHLAYRDEGNTTSEYATDLDLSPSLATKTYDLYIDVSDGGSLASSDDYSKLVTSSGSGYTVSKTNDGMLLLQGIQAGDTISLNPNVIDVNSNKMLSGFSVNESSTDSSVSCDISYEGSKWKFGFSSSDTNASHTVYVNADYDDTAQMYVDLPSGASVNRSGIDGSSDIISVDTSYSSDGYLIFTVRDGASISFADILIYDGYYTTDTATAGQVGISADSKVNVNWIEITTATLTTVPTANNLTYTGSEQALVTAGATDDGALYYSMTNTEGSWTLSVPTATDVGSYTVYYKVIGDAYHNDIDPILVEVTINKADSSVTAAPTANTLKYTGSAQALVTAGTADGGTMYYSTDNSTWSEDIPTATSTGTYTVYYKVVGDSNHNDFDGGSVSVTISSSSSSSGGSSSSSSSSSSSTTTSTTTNTDGSTTTTVTDTSAGTVTETTEYTDGTVTTVVTDTTSGTVTETTEHTDGSTTTVTTETETGTVTERVEQSDGTVIETVTDGETGTITETIEYADGTVTETVTDGETGTITSVTERADGSTVVAITDAETGVKITTETTAENIIIETVDAPETNVTASVTMPETVSTATVTIPAETTSGTVAVNADTGEIIVFSAATEDGLAVMLDSSANIVLVDNSKEFTDTEGHWAEDAIDFAASRELFSGTGEGTFSPDEPMTRGMLAQVLYNMDGGQDQVFVDIYNDVVESDWYSSAVSWASDAGVISGYGDGFYGANDTITREQMAAILHCYAQMKGYDVSHGEGIDILSYHDGGDVSEYAVEPMQWTVGAGLIQGTGEGRLDPQGSATRAQIAAILQRFITNVTIA